jgi:hypothetical protein
MLERIETYNLTFTSTLDIHVCLLGIHFRHKVSEAMSREMSLIVLAFSVVGYLGRLEYPPLLRSCMKGESSMCMSQNFRHIFKLWAGADYWKHCKFKGNTIAHYSVPIRTGDTVDEALSTR